MTIDKPESAVRSVAFSPEGRRLVSGGEDHTIRLWDAETGVELATLRGHQGSVTSVAFSSDGSILASASADKTVQMWELEEARPAKPAEPPKPAKVDRKPVKIPPAPPQEPPPAIAPFDADTARQHQEAWAEYLGVPVEFENSIGMKFMLIPPGEFDMGSTEEEVAELMEEARATNLPSWYIDRLPAETPKHHVRISRPFWLGRYEVTRSQFRRFVEERGYQTEAERDGKGGWGLVDGQSKQDPRFVWNRDLGFEQTDNHPVVIVSWNDATAFCQWLSDTEGEKYRLPTEAEWEYACRAGTKTRFHFGDDAGQLRDHAWYTGNSGWQTHPVGGKLSNAWGLYDMYGNVWEWCQDWWSVDYYGISPLADPTGAMRGSYRVNRGGSWSAQASLCRASSRHRYAPGNRNINQGFRIVKTISVLPRNGSLNKERAETSTSPVPQKHDSDPAASEPRPLPPWDLPDKAPPAAIAPFDADTARQHQEAWAEYLGVPVEFENSIGMKFMLIPPGEFDMGSTEEEVAWLLEEAKAANQLDWYIERLPSESPRHRVRITKPFWLGRYGVTRGQFRLFVEDRGYQTEAERDGKGGHGRVDGHWQQDPRFVWNGDLGFEQTDDHPVVNVSWNDATAFYEWLSAKEDETYHLPSEAQWEYACRAGTTTMWYTGDDEGALKGHAWFSFNAESRSHAVGQKTPNAWGLYDMHGNVWEWCSDWYGSGYYTESPVGDPTGPTSGSFRVFRGGCWLHDAWHCRSAYRGWIAPGNRNSDRGFRLALSSVDQSGR